MQKNTIFLYLFFCFLFFFWTSFFYLFAEEQKKDTATGFVIDKGWEIVRANCTGCHSSRLVIQNRLTRKVWVETIRWMQEEQGLWQLGDFEPVILDYLAKNYSPTTAKGKRKKLE